ncbi:glycosyl hydrolase [Paenibacillus peoriae]|uniref:glycosyl hydrolase n=1 Tax=Paenibacillus peoriae TaxID=59893 RepID=UPI0030D53558
MKKINQVLNGKESNYILPFFWQHGEQEEVLRDYMNKIEECGIRAVCVESRPHPDFIGPKWWEDLDIIMDEARKREMKVWILDDSHFPTGYAVGKIQKEFPHFQKLFLKVQQQDFVGPQKQAAILVKWATRDSDSKMISVGVEEATVESASRLNQEDKIIGVVAAKRIGMNEIDTQSLVDISDYLHNGSVYWDLPEGDWRIFTFVQTRFGGEKATEGYLNPIVPEATQILIDTVYESHYKRYKEDFGSTLAGFFSDEPRFGNIKGPFASIGRLDMVLPWREDMMEILGESISIELLPLLWVDGGIKANEVRYQYMNTVSKLYGEHFTGKLGVWCREHGVEYIGHVIEDNNAHARLGYGAGHFYRSLWEQDMSGIDVVLHQIMPGMDQGYFKSYTSTGWDGEFFHYGLAKMGSSLGHIDPKKQGRTMCEVYGAYGWGEGLKLMKWITDHMLVRGVNYFVPHAFSPKKYPDPDCPPHFYADGFDPQYRYMSVLTNYMNRISHLLTDGTHVAPVALLYHAEAEWSGDYMLFQKPARVLTQHQIDFDVVPVEVVSSASIKHGQLSINNEYFSCLVIPYSEALPFSLLTSLVGFLDQGLRVSFIDEIPSRSSEGTDIQAISSKLMQHPNCTVIPLQTLAGQLEADGINEILVSNQQAYLRYYHYQHSDGHIYMFFNEHPSQSLDTTITVPNHEKAYVYDAFENKLSMIDSKKNKRGSTFSLVLEKYESKIIIFTDSCFEEVSNSNVESSKRIHRQEINGEWNIGLSTSQEYPEFSKYFKETNLKNLALPELFPDFSGTVLYEIDFSVATLSEKMILVIEEAYEVVDVWVNNNRVGTRISPPYKFDVTKELKQGVNHLRIEVTNTLVKEQKDFLSQFLIQEPTGLIGTVSLDSLTNF